MKRLLTNGIDIGAVGVVVEKAPSHKPHVF